MNKNFESNVMAVYAELCVHWRIAHVAKLVQADDLDAKLASIESVIKAFDLAAPGQSGGDAPRPKPAAAEPQVRARKASPNRGESVILEE